MILSNRSAGKEALERGAPIRAGQRAHGVIPAYMGRRGHRPRGAFHLSVSCSNHGLPRGQAHPEMMQSTADVHHQSADTLLPQADPVFDHATALHTAVDMLDPETAVVQGLVGHVLRQHQLLAAWLLGWYADLHLGEREGEEAEILSQPAPSREGRQGSRSNTLLMDTAAVGRTQKEERGWGMDQQGICYGVVLCLAALTRLLCSRILGADNVPCRPVMGTRGGRRWEGW